MQRKKLQAFAEIQYVQFMDIVIKILVVDLFFVFELPATVFI